MQGVYNTLTHASVYIQYCLYINVHNTMKIDDELAFYLDIFSFPLFFSLWQQKQSRQNLDSLLNTRHFHSNESHQYDTTNQTCAITTSTPTTIYINHPFQQLLCLFLFEVHFLLNGHIVSPWVHVYLCA